MLREHLLLAAALESRDAYDTIERYGNPESFGPLAAVLYKAIQEYYKDDGSVQRCNRELIESRVNRGFANPKHVNAFGQFYKELPRDVSTVAVDKELREFERERIGGKLAVALANRADPGEIAELIREYEGAAVLGNVSSVEATSELIDVLDTSDLLTEKPNERYIKLAPKALNERLDGGALRGHHVLIFARPETGKTLFALNLVAGFLNQQLSVLYVGNEEPAADVRDRIRGRLLKTSKQSIRGDRATAAGRLASLQLGSLRILETSNFPDVRRALLGRDYHVLILDQVRNMRLKSDSRTAELEAAGIEARAIAKEFGVVVVSITQAGDSASGKVYLDMSDIDSSKTGLIASADLAIGIGADEAMKANGLLGFSLVKNKLSGLHDKFTVTCDFSTGIIV